MTKQTRGICLIFDIEKFDESSLGLSNRPGSSVDSNSLEMLFTAFCFKVKIVKDPTHEEVMEAMHELIADHTDIDVDMCSIFVLSHGDRDSVPSPDGVVDHGGFFYTKDNKKISTEYIIRRTKKISKLLGKPKFFAFQCCQGSDYDYLVGTDQVDRKSSESARTKIFTATEDTLVLKASSPGYVSFR